MSVPYPLVDGRLNPVLQRWLSCVGLRTCAVAFGHTDVQICTFFTDLDSTNHVLLFLPGSFVARFKMNRNDGFVKKKTCEFFSHVPALYGMRKL